MIKFKQHASGYIFIKTKTRGAYRQAKRSEVLEYFPLIFETVKNLDVHKLRRIYALDVGPVMEGTYDDIYWYNS